MGLAVAYWVCREFFLRWLRVRCSRRQDPGDSSSSPKSSITLTSSITTYTCYASYYRIYYSHLNFTDYPISYMTTTLAPWTQRVHLLFVIARVVVLACQRPRSVIAHVSIPLFQLVQRVQRDFDGCLVWSLIGILFLQCDYL